MPITYDIIVSDFGRDATIEYLRLVADAEKRLIKGILAKDNREFFDEYRRLMFTAIADLAFFKKSAISTSAQSFGYLTEDILIGLGSSSMSEDFVDRVSLSIIQEAIGAIHRGHERLRVMIPCNGLTILATRIKRVLRSMDELKRMGQSIGMKDCDLEKVFSAGIAVHTVPTTVMNYLTRGNSKSTAVPVLVLGTRGVNQIYYELAESCSASILPIEKQEYELIDEAIVASIDGDQQAVSLCRERLLTNIVNPRKNTCGSLTILEACTDFNLGIGLSSLEVFANSMVADCYDLDAIS